jgi:hypothetical protein
VSVGESCTSTRRGEVLPGPCQRLGRRFWQAAGRVDAFVLAADPSFPQGLVWVGVEQPAERGLRTFLYFRPPLHLSTTTSPLRPRPSPEADFILCASDSFIPVFPPANSPPVDAIMSSRMFVDVCSITQAQELTRVPFSTLPRLGEAIHTSPPRNRLARGQDPFPAGL